MRITAFGLMVQNYFTVLTGPTYWRNLSDIERVLNISIQV